MPSRRYQKWATVAPAFQLALEPCLGPLAPLTSFIIGLRWIVTNAFNTKLLPNWIPGDCIPYVRSIFFLTVGDLLLFAPLLFLAFCGYNLSYVSPDLDKSGQVCSYAIYLTFLTATKSNNLFSLLFGIPSNRLVGYHRWCSCLAVMLGFFHTYVAFHFGGANATVNTEDSIHSAHGTEPDLLKFLRDGRHNLTGTLLLSSMTVSVLLSIVPLRRVLFQLWLTSHIILAFTSIIMCFLHNVTTVVFVLMWWALDGMIRYLVMPCRYQAAAQIELVPTTSSDDRNLVQIRFAKPEGFDYAAGQYVQVAVPAVSRTEFHPVSIASAPHEEDIVLRFRELGDWTRKLAQVANNNNNKDQMMVLLEGPYGSMGIDLEDTDRYKTILLVAGGVGNTHCDSVAKDLLHKRQHENRPLTKLQYVWAVRHHDAVPPSDDEAVEGFEASYTPTSSPGRASTIRTSTPSPEPQRLAQIHRVGSSSFTLQSQHLNAAASSGKVEFDIYCTREPLGDDQVLDEESGRDKQRTGVRQVHMGLRPDFDSIFSRLKKTAIAAGEYNVAVVACGPQAIVNHVEEACRKYSDSVVLGCTGSTVSFDFHKESFSL